MMDRTVAVGLVAASVIAGAGVGYAFHRGVPEIVSARPAASVSVAPTASVTVESRAQTSAPIDPATSEPVSEPPAPSASSTSAADLDALVGRNRLDRPVSTWKFDYLPENADGKPLEYPVLKPGSFSPVDVGMTVGQAADTGYVRELPASERPCDAGRFARWVGRYAEGMDVLLDSEGRVISLGLRKDGPETAEGISVNSSLRALKATYGDRLEGPATMDGGASGYFVHTGDRWLGFAFADGLKYLTDRSRIMFIEATRGARPGLYRDAC